MPRASVRDDAPVHIDLPWLAESEARPSVLNEFGPVVTTHSVRLSPTSGGAGRTSDAASDPAIGANLNGETVQLSRIVAGDGGDVELRLVTPARLGSRLDFARVAQAQLAFAEPAAGTAPSRSS
jgi:hypothetical protein